MLADGLPQPLDLPIPGRQHFILTGPLPSKRPSGPPPVQRSLELRGPKLVRLQLVLGGEEVEVPKDGAWFCR